MQIKSPRYVGCDGGGPETEQRTGRLLEMIADFGGTRDKPKSIFILLSEEMEVVLVDHLDNRPG